MAYRLFNLSPHPITDDQLEAINILLAESEVFPDYEVDLTRDSVVNIPVQIDPSQPLRPQAQAIIDQLDLVEYSYVYVRLPESSEVATTITMLLNVDCFPCVVRLAPVPDVTPTRYQPIEILHFD